MSSTSRIRPHRTRASSSSSSTHSNNPSTTKSTKTDITINVYDLLPPGRLSTLLWTLGSSLLHSGVVIHSREYAYGGHNKPSLTGVYCTAPNHTPPGGRHRVSVLLGHTYATTEDIEKIVKAVSERFLGTNYNLLTNNCNHFTNALVRALVPGKTAPAWLNRAASIGLALPCMVPREWVQPPDVDSAEGALFDEAASYKDTDEEEEDERAVMLESERHVKLREDQKRFREEELRTRKEKRNSQRLSAVDTSRSGPGSPAEEGDGAVSLAGGKRITTLDELPPRFVKRMDSAGRELPVVSLPKSAVPSKT